MTYLKKIDKPDYMPDLSRMENCPEKPYGVAGLLRGHPEFSKKPVPAFCNAWGSRGAI
jgi:hypothetical protein